MHANRKSYYAEIWSASAHRSVKLFKFSTYQENGAAAYSVKFTKPILSQQTHQVESK